LAAGTYEVLVTDANDCTTIEIVTIENTEPPILAATVEESICGEANGSIALSTTNTIHPPLSYQWSVETVGNTPNAENLLAGTYVVVVTDALGCTTFQSITVPDTGGPEISLTGTEPSCSENGLISASISGGATPYELQWSTGETSQEINISEPGNYTLLVTDENGCTSTQNIDIDSNTDFPSVEVSSQSICLGELTSATATITGGASPYQIEWSNGQTGETAEGLTNNVEYTIEVTDALGCKTSDSFSIEAFAPIEGITFEAMPASCGENNGSLAAMAIGGTAPFSYDWNTDETGSQIEGLESAPYEVLVTDANGCTSISLFDLAALDAPSIQLSASAPSCNSEGDVSVTVSGGTAPYSFSWNTGETTENIQITEGGNYEVEVTDASGCVTFQDIEVIANTESPSIELNINQPCDENLGSATVNIEGGTAPYEIEWANGETGTDADGLATGVFYNVLVTDANGCEVSQTFVVEALAGIEAVEAMTMAASCEQANGRVSLQIMGGTAPYSYDWSTGETSENLEGLSTGIYTVVVTDANGCTFVQEANIEAIANPMISIATENANCNEANGRAMASVTGGTAPYTFLWDTGETTENIEGLPSGTYDLTITDANGCEVIQSASISDEGAPDASFSVPAEFCIAEGELVMTNIQTNGGVFAVNGETIEGNSWMPNMAGEVSISYSLTENGCTSIEEQMVTVVDVFDVCVSDLPLTILANDTNGDWSSDMGSEILIETDSEGNRTITFTADIEAHINSASFSITYQGGADNCKMSQSNVIQVNKLPQVPEIIGESQFCGTANAPELTLNKFPEFCNCPTTFNVYDDEGNLLKEGETFDNDVFDTAPFIEESGIYTFGVTSINGPCESNVELFTMEVFEEVTANL
ncbi:MAG: SprB repeat-containing protein, partial [Chitinophagales bacterium]